MKKIRIWVGRYFQYMDQIDWFLLLFMIILMTQTIYNLFFNEAIGNTSTIDTAIRTTMAGLFGYYIGKGFMQGSSKKSDNTKDISVTNSEDLAIEATKILSQVTLINEDNSDEVNSRRNIQVMIVGSLGIVSLIILIIARNMDISTVEKIPTVSQLRDFVSGSTGFLISQSKK